MNANLPDLSKKSYSEEKTYFKKKKIFSLNGQFVYMLG